MRLTNVKGSLVEVERLGKAVLGAGMFAFLELLCGRRGRFFNCCIVVLFLLAALHLNSF